MCSSIITYTIPEPRQEQPEDFIKILQIYYTTTCESKDEDECLVCTQRLCDIDGCTKNEHEEPLRLPCGHVIGTDCAATWFKEHNSCPYCRAELYLKPKSHWF